MNGSATQTAITVPGNTNQTETALQAHLEFVIKLGTVTVGILYVLGLLVTNVHLMGLGIADFSALQSRFVLTGLLFLCYWVLLMAGPVAFVFGTWGFWQYCKNFPTAFRVTFMSIALCWAAWFVLLIYGSLLADLYPWGPSYESQWSGALHLRETFRFTKLSLQYAREAFFHPKIAAGFFVVCVCIAVFLVLRKISPQSHLGRIALWFLPFPLFLTLFGYAQNVFPNMPYNLGGGQPRVVQLYVRDTATSFLSASGLAMDVPQGQPKVSVPLALWYQDAAFFYVTPMRAQNSGAAHLTAIPVADVANVTYLAGYVKVAAGGRIVETHVDFAPRQP